MAYFYSLLFTANPELRAMFPLAMDEQRRALSGALARCVWSMDNPQSLHEYLAGLGRDHRKYGVQERHYQVFGETLATALRLLNGRAWTAGNGGRVAHGGQPHLLGDGRGGPGGGGPSRRGGSRRSSGTNGAAPTWPCSPSGPASHFPTCRANT